jgi:hypothetical protein
MLKKLVVAVVVLLTIVGIVYALGPAGKINHTQCNPGSVYTVGWTHNSVMISADLVYDTTTFVVTKPDTGEAYIEIFPPLGWPFVKEDEDITVELSYSGTKQESLSPKGLYGLDVNAGWIYLYGAVDQGGYFSFEYQTRRIAARSQYALGKANGEFKAFKIDDVK